MADRRAGVAKRRMLEATLEIVIEQRAGEEGRWEWERDREAVVFRHELEPMPTHYGCWVEIMTPADGELLDVMLLDLRRPYERGGRTAVRVIDVLRRSDGDDKLLAVPVDGAWPSAPMIERARKEIWAWYVAHEKPVTRWGGGEDALAAIRAWRGDQDRSVSYGDSSKGPVRTGVVSMQQRRVQAIEALRPYIERAREFSGWTFDDVRIRRVGPPLPWDYEAIAREQAAGATSMVDLGTGGGERLAGVVGGPHSAHPVSPPTLP